MIIRLTGKLAKKIGVMPSGVLPEDPNPFADWSAHLFRAEQKEYILITNTASLYSMVLSGAGITTGNKFMQRVVSYIGETLRDDGFGGVFARDVVPATSLVSFSKALNQSVTGSMNDLVFQAQVGLIESEVPPYSISFRLNEVPMSYLKYKHPRCAFQWLVGEKGGEGEVPGNAPSG